MTSPAASATMRHMTTLPPVPAPVRRVPSHGKGLLQSWQPGQSGNPSGRSGLYGEVVKMAQQASPAIMHELITIALDPGVDERVRVVAANAVLERGFGRPREVSKEEQPPGMTIDFSKLPRDALEVLYRAVQLGCFKPAEPAATGDP